MSLAAARKYCDYSTERCSSRTAERVMLSPYQSFQNQIIYWKRNGCIKSTTDSLSGGFYVLRFPCLGPFACTRPSTSKPAPKRVPKFMEDKVKSAKIIQFTNLAPILFHQAIIRLMYVFEAFLHLNFLPWALPFCALGQKRLQ